MRSTICKSPYRSPAVREKRKIAERFPDADILVLLLVASPALLAVFIHALLQNEPIGAGTTVCGAIAVLAAAMFISEWRSSGRRAPKGADPDSAATRDP
jgi:hypothetical protein